MRCLIELAWERAGIIACVCMADMDKKHKETGTEEGASRQLCVLCYVYYTLCMQRAMRERKLRMMIMLSTDALSLLFPTMVIVLHCVQKDGSPPRLKGIPALTLHRYLRPENQQPQTPCYGSACSFLP